MPRDLTAPRHRPINESFRIGPFAADNTPENGPGFEVPPGASVFVRAHSGAVAGNVEVIYVATSRDDLLTSLHRLNLAPNTQIAFPVMNLRQIWAMGKTGDGAQIQVVSS